MLLMLQKWLNPLSRALNSAEYIFTNRNELRDKRAAERGDQRENFPSAVLFIASSTPTFCGYSAPSQRRGDGEPHILADGSVADGSRGSPQAPGMWHRTPWRRVRAASCPPSHNPSPGVVTWVVASGRHRWTLIQPHLICGLHRTSPCGGAADVKMKKEKQRTGDGMERLFSKVGYHLCGSRVPLWHMGSCKSMESALR